MSEGILTDDEVNFAQQLGFENIGSYLATGESIRQRLSDILSSAQDILVQQKAVTVNSIVDPQGVVTR